MFRNDCDMIAIHFMRCLVSAKSAYVIEITLVLLFESLSTRILLYLM